MYKKSIKNRLIVLLLLATIIPFGLSIVVTFLYTKESIKEQSVQENVNLLYQGKVNVENYLKELNNHILSNYNNQEFMYYLKTSNKMDDYASMRPVNQVLQSLLYADESIHKVSLSIVENNKLVSVSRQSAIVYSGYVTDRDKEYYKLSEESPYNLFINKITGSSNITLHRAFKNVPSNNVLAFFSFVLKPDKINELSQNLYNQDAEEFYILTPEGDFIYQSSEDKGEKDNRWVKQLLHTGEINGTLDWKDDSFDGVMVYDTLSDSTGRWILVKRLPFTTLHESAYQIATINIVFGVIGLSLVILATFFVSIKITTPIKQLLGSIRQVEKGNLKVEFPSFGNDEIGFLGHRFKQMMEKINHHINREYKLELENKTNQLKVLQSQINPHFLYNTLQSIGTTALKSNVPDIYSSLTDLSKIMRYSMNIESGIVPLSAEINYTKSYMLLQKKRFGDDLDYVIDIKEDTLHVHVPKMTLQPIIENYFKHGFNLREGTGKINLACWKDDDFLFIEIYDNGVGVSEKRLKDIHHQLYGEDKSDSHIGLKNVYTRLNLYYSGNVLFECHNRNEGGFLVEIKLPLNVEDGFHESNYR